MFENPFVQFAVELIRALLVDALSGRVRARFACFLRPCARSYRRALLAVHRRNRDRLLNKLHTGEGRQV
jgi:hypothetical protein